MQLLLQHPNIPVSIDAKEFLFTRASSTNAFNHLRQMIQIWEICSFTPKVFMFMVRFYCIQNSLELAYCSASQFFEKFTNQADYSVSVVNILAAYSNPQWLLSHFLPLCKDFGLNPPALFHYKFIRKGCKEADSAAVSQHLKELFQQNLPIHPAFLDEILDSPLELPKEMYSGIFSSLKQHAQPLTEKVKVLILKKLLAIPSLFDFCFEFVMEDEASSAAIETLLEHILESRCDFQAVDLLFEKICLSKKIQLSERCFNLLISIAACSQPGKGC